MRKVIVLFGLVMSSLFALTGCDVSQMSSLPELSKPYTGFYECETLSYGGEDALTKFESVMLELDYSGKFQLSYRTENGNTGKYGGTYSMDLEAEEITFSAHAGLRSVSRSFAYRDGTILVEMPINGKLLYAVFKLP